MIFYCPNIDILQYYIDNFIAKDQIRSLLYCVLESLVVTVSTQYVEKTGKLIFFVHKTANQQCVVYYSWNWNIILSSFASLYTDVEGYLNCKSHNKGDYLFCKYINISW